MAVIANPAMKQTKPIALIGGIGIMARINPPTSIFVDVFIFFHPFRAVICMKSFYKRIIAGACAIVTLFLSCVPSSAAGIGIGFDLSPTDLWSWLNDIGYHTGNFWGSFIDKDLCPQSSNPGGRHNFIEQRTTVDGKTGVYYICEYCGKSAGEVGNTAYDSQVSEMPVTGYASDGSLLYSPDPWYIRTEGNGHISCEHDPQASNGTSWNCFFNCTVNSVQIVPFSGSSTVSSVDYVKFYYNGIAPVDGYYTVQNTSVVSGYCKDDVNNITYPTSSGWSGNISNYYYSAGASFNCYGFVRDFRSRWTSYVYFQGLPPVLKIVPVASLDTTT